MIYINDAVVVLYSNCLKVDGWIWRRTSCSISFFNTILNGAAF